MVKALCVLAIVPLIAGACGAEQAAAGRPLHRSTPTAQAAASTRTQDGCALTIPSSPAFIPPDPYPSQPPELYQAEWYGSADLWTMLGPEGEVWEDLPERGGKFTQKLLWWSEDLSAGEGPTPITLTGRRLDRPGSFEERASGGVSSRADVGDFMVTGLAIPAGCWELTAAYRDAELTHVVLVKGLE